MKRDLEIVRRIAIEVRDMDQGFVLTGLDDVEYPIFAEHAILMVEAGLIQATVQVFHSGEPPKVQVQRLTWAGQDFAQSIANDTTWNTIKTKFIKPGASWTFGILTELIKQEIQSGYPTLLGQ